MAVLAGRARTGGIGVAVTRANRAVARQSYCSARCAEPPVKASRAVCCVSAMRASLSDTSWVGWRLRAPCHRHAARSYTSASSTRSLSMARISRSWSIMHSSHEMSARSLNLLRERRGGQQTWAHTPKPCAHLAASLRHAHAIPPAEQCAVVRAARVGMQSDQPGAARNPSRASKPWRSTESCPTAWRKRACCARPGAPLLATGTQA